MSEQSIDDLIAELRRAVETRDVGLFGVDSSPGRSPHPDSILTGLLEAGARRQLAQRLKADATGELIAWVRAAHEAGWEIKRIAELAGVTRATIYAWLGSRGDG